MLMENRGKVLSWPSLLSWPVALLLLLLLLLVAVCLVGRPTRCRHSAAARCCAANCSGLQRDGWACRPCMLCV
jgi:hypothetical protein